MNEQIIKNWVTVPRKDIDKALKHARKCSEYITNDYAVIGGRKEHYEEGNDYDNIDFFWMVCDKMYEFEHQYGVK